MTSKNAKLTLVALIALTVVLGIWRLYYVRSQQPSSSQQVPERVRVAINLPLSGPIAAFMGPYPDALRMGLEDGFAKAGRPLNSFELNVQDNAGSPSQAVAVVQQQLARGFDAYVSGSSEMCTAVLPFVTSTGVPHFLIAFDAYMTSKCANCLRILPSYKSEGPEWVEYVKRRGAKRVALLTLNNAPIEEEFNRIVEPGLKALGTQFMRERFEWTGSDYRTLALKVQKYKPDAILVNGYSVHLYPIVSALRSLGLVHAENVLVGLDFDDLLYNGTPKQDLEGVAFVAPLFEVASSAQLRQWKQRFEDRFHKRATWVAAYAYDTGFALATASLGKPKVSKTDIRAVLPFDGVAGRIALDVDGDSESTIVLAKLDSQYSAIRLFP